MKLPIYLLCTLLAVAVRTEENVAFYGKQVEQQRPLGDEQETSSSVLTEQEAMGYLLPKLMTKYYRPNREWNPRLLDSRLIDPRLVDPRLILLTDSEANSLVDQVCICRKKKIYFHL